MTFGALLGMGSELLAQRAEYLLMKEDTLNDTDEI